MELQLGKVFPLTGDVIFVDGLWGTGKSIIAPIISGMERVEKQRIAPIYEHLCGIHALGTIDENAVVSLLQLHADIDQYHSVIGREVNLRWNDFTGLNKNPNTFRYIKRLWGGEGDDYIGLINGANLALFVMSHIILPIANPLVKALGSRLYLVEIVRHPLYMVNHWYNYLQRFDSPREFTLSVNVDGKKIPWFAYTWSEEYLQAFGMDRALQCIIRLYNDLELAFQRLETQHAQILVLSFEEVVFDPMLSMDSLAAFLGRKHHPQLKHLLRQQRIPRKTILQGYGYSSYGWKQNDSPEETVYFDTLRAVEQSASPEIFARFLALISYYNSKWPSKLSEFHRT